MRSVRAFQEPEGILLCRHCRDDGPRFRLDATVRPATIGDPSTRTTSTVRARVSRPGQRHTTVDEHHPRGHAEQVGAQAVAESHVGGAGPLPQGAAVGAQLDVLPRRGVVAPLGRGADTAAVAAAVVGVGEEGQRGGGVTAGVLDGLPDGAGVEVHPLLVGTVVLRVRGDQALGALAGVGQPGDLDPVPRCDGRPAPRVWPCPISYPPSGERRGPGTVGA